MLEIIASLLIGTLVVVSVMAGVVKADEYFYKRKRYREIQEAHDERMNAMVERNADYMLRMGMNPAYAINNSMPLCTASRSSILTDMPRPEPMTRPKDIPEWDGVAVNAMGPFIPWRSINETYREQVEANNAAMDRMAEDAKERNEIVTLYGQQIIPVPESEVKPKLVIDYSDPIPAPDVFRLPSPMHDYLKSEGLLPEEVDDET